jgi:hypothetical protein
MYLFNYLNNAADVLQGVLARTESKAVWDGAAAAREPGKVMQARDAEARLGGGRGGHAAI